MEPEPPEGAVPAAAPGGQAAPSASAAAAAAAAAAPTSPPYAVPPASGRCLLLDYLPAEILADEIAARLARRHLAALRLACRALCPVAGAAARRLAIRGNDGCKAAQLGLFRRLGRDSAGGPQSGGGSGGSLAQSFPRAATLHLSPASMHDATYVLPSLALDLATPLARSGALRTIVVRDALPEDLPADDKRAAELGRHACGMCPAWSTTYDLSGPLAALAMCSPGLRAFRFSTHFVSEAEVAAICRVPPSSSSSSSSPSTSSSLRLLELRGAHGVRAGGLSGLARDVPGLRTLILGESQQGIAPADVRAVASLPCLESLELGGGAGNAMAIGLLIHIHAKLEAERIRLAQRLPALLPPDCDPEVAARARAAQGVRHARPGAERGGGDAADYLDMFVTAAPPVAAVGEGQQPQPQPPQQQQQQRPSRSAQEQQQEQQRALLALADALSSPSAFAARLALPPRAGTEARRRRRWLAAARREEPGGRGAARQRPVKPREKAEGRRYQPPEADPPPPLLLPAVADAMEEAAASDGGGDSGADERSWPHAEPDAGTDEGDAGDSCDGGHEDSDDEGGVGGAGRSDDALLPAPVALALAEARAAVGNVPTGLRRLVLRWDTTVAGNAGVGMAPPRYLGALTSLSLSWRREKQQPQATYTTPPWPAPQPALLGRAVGRLRHLRRLRLGFPLGQEHVQALSSAITGLTYLAAMRLDEPPPAPARRAWLRRWRREQTAPAGGGGGGGGEEGQSSSAAPSPLPPPLLLEGSHGIFEHAEVAPFKEMVFLPRETDVLVAPSPPCSPVRDRLGAPTHPPETLKERRLRRLREERDSYRARPRFSRGELRRWPPPGGKLPSSRAAWRDYLHVEYEELETDSQEGEAPTDPESEGRSSDDDRVHGEHMFMMVRREAAAAVTRGGAWNRRKAARRMGAAAAAAAAAASASEAGVAATGGSGAPTPGAQGGLGNPALMAQLTAAYLSLAHPFQQQAQQAQQAAGTLPAPASAPAPAPPAAAGAAVAPPPPPVPPPPHAPNEADLPMPGEAGAAHDDGEAARLPALPTVLRLRARLPMPPLPPRPPPVWAADYVRWDVEDLRAHEAADIAACDAAAAERQSGPGGGDGGGGSGGGGGGGGGGGDDDADADDAADDGLFAPEGEEDFLREALSQVHHYRKALRKHMRQLRACSRWVFALPAHFPGLVVLELDADGCIPAAAVEAIPFAAPALESLLLPHSMIGPGQGRALASIGARLPRLRRLRVGLCGAPGYGPPMPWRSQEFDPAQGGDENAQRLLDAWHLMTHSGHPFSADQRRRGDQPWVAFGALFGAWPLAGEWARWALGDVARERAGCRSGPRGPATSVDPAHTRRARALDSAAPALGLAAAGGDGPAPPTSRPYLPALDHLEVVGPLPAGCLEAIATWAYPRGLASLTLHTNPCRNLRSALKVLVSASGGSRPSRLRAVVARRCAGLHRLAEADVMRVGQAAGAPISRVDFDDPCAPRPVRAPVQPPTDDDENEVGDDEEEEGSGAGVGGQEEMEEGVGVAGWAVDEEEGEGEDEEMSA